MFWGYPMWWGMPFGMFLFPVFFLICIGCMVYFFSREIPPFGYRNYNDEQTNKELLQEVHKLRQEVEELKKIGDQKSKL